MTINKKFQNPFINLFQIFNDYMQTDEQITEQLRIIQLKIFQKMDQLKSITRFQQDCSFQQINIKKNTGDLVYPKYDKKNCYYQQFWKVFLLNQIIISKVKDYSNLNKQILASTTELQELHQQWNQLWAFKTKKKVRRTSDMIQKIFICPFQKCAKNYGSDVSLNLHMKLKHNSGTKTERQMLAKQIILAQEKGQKVKMNINFPPGFLEKFREQYYNEINNVVRQI